LITHAPGGADGFFMLLLAPPVGAEGTMVPRDLSLVVDVSGSMSGEKLHQAQAALDQALGTLGEHDRFRIIAFSSTVRHFREGYTPATRENLLEARRFVQNATRPQLGKTCSRPAGSCRTCAPTVAPTSKAP